MTDLRLRLAALGDSVVTFSKCVPEFLVFTSTAMCVHDGRKTASAAVVLFAQSCFARPVLPTAGGSCLSAATLPVEPAGCLLSCSIQRNTFGKLALSTAANTQADLHVGAPRQRTTTELPTRPTSWMIPDTRPIGRFSGSTPGGSGPGGHKSSTPAKHALLSLTAALYLMLSCNGFHGALPSKYRCARAQPLSVWVEGRGSDGVCCRLHLLL